MVGRNGSSRFSELSGGRRGSCQEDGRGPLAVVLCRVSSSGGLPGSGPTLRAFISIETSGKASA